MHTQTPNKTRQRTTNSNLVETDSGGNKITKIINTITESWLENKHKFNDHFSIRRKLVRIHIKRDLKQCNQVEKDSPTFIFVHILLGHIVKTVVICAHLCKKISSQSQRVEYPLNTYRLACHNRVGKKDWVELRAQLGTIGNTIKFNRIPTHRDV